MHTIPPTVLEEMLSAHRHGSFPAFNLGFFGASAERAHDGVDAMLDQPGFACRVRQAWGHGWIEQMGYMDEALSELARRGMQGTINLEVLREGEVIFDRRSSLGFDKERADVEFVFDEERLNVVDRLELWHSMVNYACHAARVAEARCVLVYDGTLSLNDIKGIIAGRHPSRGDQIIWVDR